MFCGGHTQSPAHTQSHPSPFLNSALLWTSGIVARTRGKVRQGRVGERKQSCFPGDRTCPVFGLRGGVGPANALASPRPNGQYFPGRSQAGGTSCEKGSCAPWPPPPRLGWLLYTPGTLGGWLPCHLAPPGAWASFQLSDGDVINAIRHQGVLAFPWNDFKVKFKYSIQQMQPSFRHLRVGPTKAGETCPLSLP